MNNYIKLITILNEIRLPENASICYFHKDKSNDVINNNEFVLNTLRNIKE